MESKIEGFGGQEEKVSSILNKFKEMDNFIDDLEKKLNDIESSREKVLATEEKLMNMQKTTNEQIEKLNTLISNSNGEGRGNGNIQKQKKFIHKNRLSRDMETKKESVLKLHDRGFDVDKISTLLNMGKNEVKMIIDYDKNG